MEIIAHRGAWAGDAVNGIPACAKNSIDAFKIAAEFGFGIETDFRYALGEIVISHNPPDAQAPTARAFLSAVRPGQIICVNVKADGLAADLKALFDAKPEVRPFAFDMSVPDTLGYEKAGFPYLERQSEYETVQVWPNASGYWLDGFNGTWFTKETIERLAGRGRPVCIVSSDLHGRDNRPLWEMLRSLLAERPDLSEKLWLCTDAPFEASRSFKEAR